MLEEAAAPNVEVEADGFLSRIGCAMGVMWIARWYRACRKECVEQMQGPRMVAVVSSERAAPETATGKDDTMVVR